MALWDIDISVTLPASASEVMVTALGSAGGSQSIPSNFGGLLPNLTYDDANGSTFILIFELLDSSKNPIGAQPIAHGPYVASDVGTPSGGN